MLRIATLFFCLISAPCNALGDFVVQCNNFKSELTSESQRTGTGFDLKFSGSVDAFGGGLSRLTLLSFGESKLKIPFVGEEQINLGLSIDSIVKKTDAGTIVTSFFDDVKYKDVGVEFLNLKESSSTVFDKPVLYGWLTYNGFEHTADDLNCSGEESEAKEVIAYLLAKALWTESGAVILKLSEYDVGFAQINKAKNILALVVLDGDNVLKVTFKAEPHIDIFDWLGIDKVTSM